MAKLLVGAFALIGLAACGSDGDGGAADRSCLRSGDAQICADVDDGAVRLTADGLKPGSDLTVDGEGFDAQTFTIGAAGTPEGAIGFFPGDTGPVTVAVTGTAADGSPLAGEVHTGD